LHRLHGVGQFFTHLVGHQFADALDVAAETHAVGLDVHIAQLGDVLVEDAVLFREMDDFHCSCF